MQTFLLISSAHAANALTEFSQPHETETFDLAGGVQVVTHRFGEYQLVEVSIPSASASATVHDLRIKGDAAKAYRPLATPNTVAIIGGGFFGYNSEGEEQPIGLTRVDSERKVALMPWSHGGVFASDGNGTLRIFPAESKGQGGRWKYALQSKPIIILNGNVDVGRNFRDAEFNRVAFGLTSEGDVLIVGLFQNFGQAATQVKFAQIFKAIADQRGLKVLRALAMDGGAGAQVHIPKLKMRFGDTGVSYFPNAIRFENVAGR
ncbi:phosphodiester glycosidase family protein [Pseudomonas fluorescens]|uniref:phosphodiester glycosidase family protein n=1 Tax=Pseudomonas fluorescens TaxID=294 RepID=UPI0038054760